MKKLISIFAVSVIVFFSSAIMCKAKTSLTYFDTVVFQSQNETTREHVLNQVLTQAKEVSSKPTTTFYSVVDYPETASCLKEIISNAANTFFRK